MSGLIEKTMSRKKKIKSRYFPGTKIKDMDHYAISLLGKKPENVILHYGRNDATYKFGSNILKDLIQLKNFILKKLPSCKKTTFLSPAVHVDKPCTKKNNKIFTNRLKEQGIPYITHGNIVHKHLYGDGLRLNLVCSSIFAENFRLKLKTKGKK